MDVAITMKKAVVPEEVRRMAHDRVCRLERYLPSIDRAEICFVEEPNHRVGGERDACEVTLYAPGKVLHAKAVASDPLAAMDRAVRRIGEQCARRRGRFLVRSQARMARSRADGFLRPPYRRASTSQ